LTLIEPNRFTVWCVRRNVSNGKRANVRYKKSLPLTYLFVSILVMVGLHFLYPAAAIIPFPWSLLGIIPLGVGITVNLVADRAFKRHNTTVKPFGQPTTLVTSGVFRISRNPMYLGFVLILIGIAIFMGSLTPYSVIPVFAVVMDTVFVRSEEEMLHATFGENRLEYKKKVRRWT
jgi:protein-S-isoprenylcysteine O-methyltransferase Ste14